MTERSYIRWSLYLLSGPGLGAYHYTQYLKYSLNFVVHILQKLELSKERYIGIIAQGGRNFRILIN